MEWKFRALTPNDTRINATHLEFFRDEALTNPVDALVREDIQNRLDAHATGCPPVEVRYRFADPDCELPPPAAERWLKGLRKHLESPESREDLDGLPARDERMSFLTIEDFNTTGLAGDPSVTSDPAAGSARNDFYWFIRNVGRSGKKGGDRGRWGLGKIVYPASSRIRAFFAYTVRRSDGQRHLIGRSVLAVHRIGETDHESEGYFGRFDSAEFPYFATPESDPSFLDRFCREFQLSRTLQEPGLSLVIPFPAADITHERLVESVIEHYFLELLRGRLVVRVSRANEDTVLSRATIEDVVRTWKGTAEFQREETLARIAFAREAIEHSLSGPSHFRLSGFSKPRWQDLDQRFGGEVEVTTARQLWLDGKMISFHVPVKVTRKDGTRNDVAGFTVYLRRDETSSHCSESFIRDGLAITEEGKLREPGVRALALFEDNALSELLGDSENPAHTRWLENSKHFRNKYELGPTILRFVKSAPTQLVAFLQRRDEPIITDLLQQLFYVPLPEGDRRKKPSHKPGGETKKPEPPKPPAPRYIICERQDGGFVLKPSPQATATPASIIVRLAYETLRGNPFKQHHPADFDFVARSKEFQYSGHGVELQMLEPNRFRVKVLNPDFLLRITGFDPNRDLIVDARAELRKAGSESVEEEAEEESEEEEFAA